MIRRRSGPSLLGRAANTAARTALIAGTATVVSNKVAGGRQNDPAPPAAAPEPEAAGGLSIDAMDQLKKLAELHASGILTDEEFAAQKARILG